MSKILDSFVVVSQGLLVGDSESWSPDIVTLPRWRNTVFQSFLEILGSYSAWQTRILPLSCIAFPPTPAGCGPYEYYSFIAATVSREETKSQKYGGSFYKSKASDPDSKVHGEG